MALMNRPCDGVYLSSATFLPTRSSMRLMSGSRAITASAPWVLSTIMMARPSSLVLIRLGCSCAQKSEVRQAHCAVLLSKMVVSVGMSSWMMNSTFTPAF